MNRKKYLEEIQRKNPIGLAINRSINYQTEYLKKINPGFKLLLKYVIPFDHNYYVNYCSETYISLNIYNYNYEIFDEYVIPIEYFLDDTYKNCIEAEIDNAIKVVEEEKKKRNANIKDLKEKKIKELKKEIKLLESNET